MVFPTSAASHNTNVIVRKSKYVLLHWFFLLYLPANSIFKMESGFEYHWEVLEEGPQVTAVYLNLQ